MRQSKNPHSTIIALPLEHLEAGCDAVQRLQELREPIFGLAMAAKVCQRWLDHDAPDSDEVRALIVQMIEVSGRAVTIIKR